jgi:hypothetical protein
LPYAQPSGKNIDRLAFHKFHGEEWLAVFDVSGAQHAGDIRMSERSENLPLLQEVFALSIACARRQQLHSHLLSYLSVGSLSQVHRTHAPAPDHFQQTVWPTAPTAGVEAAEAPGWRQY